MAVDESRDGPLLRWRPEVDDWTPVIATTIATHGFARLADPRPYRIASQLRIDRPGVALEGVPGARLQLAPGTRLPDGPPGAPTAVHVTGARVRVAGLHLDGDRAHNAQPMFGLAVTGPGCTLERLHATGWAGDVHLGAAVRFSDADGGVARDLTCEDNGSVGFSIFRGSRRIRAAGIVTRRNGIGGVEVEGDGTRDPIDVELRDVTSHDNLANDLNVKHASRVRVHALDAAGGGNNGAIKVIATRDLLIAGFTVRAPVPVPSGGNPMGLWIHAEGTTRPSVGVCAVGGTIDGAGDATWPADAVRVTGAASDLLLLGVRGTRATSRAGRGGWGIALDPAGGSIERLQLVGCDFAGNAAGAADVRAREAAWLAGLPGRAHEGAEVLVSGFAWQLDDTMRALGVEAWTVPAAGTLVGLVAWGDAVADARLEVVGADGGTLGRLTRRAGIPGSAVRLDAPPPLARGDRVRLVLHREGDVVAPGRVDLALVLAWGARAARG